MAANATGSVTIGASSRYGGVDFSLDYKRGTRTGNIKLFVLQYGGAVEILALGTQITLANDPINRPGLSPTALVGFNKGIKAEVVSGSLVLTLAMDNSDANATLWKIHPYSVRPPLS